MYYKDQVIWSSVQRELFMQRDGCINDHALTKDNQAYIVTSKCLTDEERATIIRDD